MFAFFSKMPNYSGMMKAISKIREIHAPYEYLNPFCIDNDDCNCCGFNVCNECNSHYPCPTIVILNEEE